MSPKKQWNEIDALRGLAVVFMILNHAGVGWIDVRVGNGVIADSLVLLGSYAPVLFFFVTGVGYGVSHDPARERRSSADVVYKAVLLLVADAFWRGDAFPAPGLDFLGFIGLSMLVLHFGCSGPRGQAAAWGILLATLAVRYGLGPPLREAVPSGSWIQALVGNTPMPGWSYWFVPWLAYPALGFLFGDAVRRLDARGRGVGRVAPSLLLLGVAVGVAVAIMARHGLLFMRFGTMSLAFFVSSLAVLAFSTAFAWVVCAPGRPASIAALLSLRGVSSYVVVPIHMFLIVIVAHAVSLPLSGPVYAVSMLPFVAVNYALARRADRAAGRLGTRAPFGGGAWLALTAMLAAAAVAMALLSAGFPKVALATVAQLLVAIMLTVRPMRTTVA